MARHGLVAAAGTKMVPRGRICKPVRCVQPTSGGHSALGAVARLCARWRPTFCGYKKLAISKHKTFNLHESLIEKLNFI
jgi:hypothetical protein